MDLLRPIKTIFEDVNFENVDFLRVKVWCNLKEYKFYHHIFTYEKPIILYFYDYIVYINENSLIKKSPNGKMPYYDIDNINNISEIICFKDEIFDIIDDLVILNSLNNISSIMMKIIKIIVIINNCEGVNLERYDETFNNFKFSNDEIENLLQFISDNCKGVLSKTIINSNDLVILNLINNFKRTYKLEDIYKLTLENTDITNQSSKKELSVIAKEILNIINLPKIVCNYLEKNKKQIDDIKCNSEQSQILYHSIITQTNWLEELEYGNFMGLLINIHPKEINLNGYNFDFIPINSITNTVITFEQFLEAYEISGKYNLWENVLSGNGVGEGNNILPLYINSHHWNIVKYFYKFYLGMTFNRNCIDFIGKYSNIYKNVFIKMINMTYCNENYSSDKWLNLLFSVGRTYNELFGKDGKKDIEKFKIDKLFRIECNINDILLQYIFSDDEDDNIIKYIFEEVVRRTLKSLYKDISKLDDLYSLNEDNALNYENIPNDWLHDINFNTWINELQENTIFSEKLTLIHGITMIKKVINNNMYFFDKNYGVLDNESLNFLKSHVKSHKMKPENQELIGIMLPNFKSHINFTKDKIFTINCLKDLGIVSNRNELKCLLIQCLMQRVNKSRRNAIVNKKIQNPFEQNDIIKSTGMLISHRYLKKFYNLNICDRAYGGSYVSYLHLINKSHNEEKLSNICNILISKTISVKKYVLQNINLIDEKVKKQVLDCLT